jgi:hypothetical protein
MASPYVFCFSDDTMIPSGGLKAKETAQTIFGQKVLQLEEFQSGGLLGSHLIRKFASTHVRRCGISKDDKDTRGAGKKREEFRIDMMIWNYHILIAKWQKSYALVDRVSI